MPDLTASLDLAASWIASAGTLLITAGAGIGIDSGLPDFRGPQGFWGAYPGLRKQALHFEDIASQEAFMRDPRQAWGFYGHRLNLYRATQPHAGFGILRAFAARMRHGAAVYTSNVDSQFQKAGFTAHQVTECHGSIHHLQCLGACTTDIWPTTNFHPVVDHEACRLLSDLPQCPYCGGIARPNVLMFSDWTWLSERTDLQQGRLTRFLAQASDLVVIETGAGTAIPSVRRKSEAQGTRLIRINLRESQVRSASAVGLPMRAIDGLQGLHDRLDPLSSAI